MTAAEALEKVLQMYGQYYTLKRDAVAAPFQAEGECIVNDEQYTAYRTVKISSVVSREIVFFAAEEHLTAEKAQRLADAAWAEGFARVEPGPNHRNTDIVLVVLADRIDPDAAALLKKTKHSKNFKFTFHGWSVFRLVAIETPSGTMTCNRMGQNLKKLFSNIKF